MIHAEVKLYIKTDELFQPEDLLFDFIEKVYNVMNAGSYELVILEAEIIAAGSKAKGSVLLQSDTGQIMKPIVVDILHQTSPVNLAEIRLTCKGAIDILVFENIIEEGAASSVQKISKGRIEMPPVKYLHKKH